MKKIRRNYSQVMQYIFVVDFVPALWRKKKLIKLEEKTLKKNTSQRERDAKRERERERERER